MKSQDIAKFLRKKLRQAPKGQLRGPIRLGPPGLRVCRRCTVLLGVPAVGVPNRVWRSHVRAHADGIIRAPS